MRWLVCRIGLLVPLLLAIGGSCAPIRKEVKSPLTPPRMSPGAVVLDLFFIRVPFGDPAANVHLWNEIDEQHFPPETRRELTRHGFRVGLIDGQMPWVMSELLELKDKPAPSGDFSTVDVVGADSSSRVTRRHMPLLAGRRGLILTSEVYEKFPVLTCASGEVCGRDYPKGQGIVAVKANLQRDGRVRLDLVPELHHGEVRQQFVGDQGMLRLEAAKSRRVFDELAVSATLTPGHMIVLGSLPDRPGSLGHYFFTCNHSGELQQRLLVIRLAQTQHDDLFAPTDVLPLDDLAF